ncbi:hypothetical protein ACTJJ0_29415 [Chitinophaga sp. 22321]|uniref:Uncharacterized protein n=2 Tax=Chitinophaga TaxID=79328 RepID=A0ABS5J7Q1_9BACT|nr:hypothetical protein [Chitinophaga hostae]MBS0031116.1 hypothetical protein [Chitinophaga hostae]
MVVLFLVACLPRARSTHPVTLVLKDNRGVIKMDIPNEWDTLIQWTHYSDCGPPCDKIKYRFQPKIFPIAQENGELYTKSPADSVDQLTIEHEAEKFAGSAPDIASLRNGMKQMLLKEGYRDHLVIDTVIMGGKDSIPVTGFSREVSHIKKFNIRALVRLKGDLVLFEFELRSRKPVLKDGIFVQKVTDIIRSLKLVD